MKKILVLSLAIVSLFAVTSNAFALTGVVSVNDYLNVRKTAPSGTVIGYLGNGNVVTILDGGAQTSGFYRITANCYLNRDLTGSRVQKTGYGSSAYIR